MLSETKDEIENENENWCSTHNTCFVAVAIIIEQYAKKKTNNNICHGKWTDV